MTVTGLTKLSNKPVYTDTIFRLPETGRAESRATGNSPRTPPAHRKQRAFTAVCKARVDIVTCGHVCAVTCMHLLSHRNDIDIIYFVCMYVCVCVCVRGGGGHWRIIGTSVLCMSMYILAVYLLTSTTAASRLLPLLPNIYHYHYLNNHTS